MIQEIAAAIVLGFFVCLLSRGRGGAKSADQEWYDEVERHRRGED